MESYVSRQEYENLQKLSAEPPWDGGMTWSALMDTAKEMAGVSPAPRSSGAGDPERLRNAVNTAYHAMLFNVNYFCRLASIILAGSPPVLDPAAGPLRCGSWGR